MDPPRRSAYLMLVLVLSAGFFAYAVLRAIRVSFTIDEAQTYIRYLSAGPAAIFDFGVANNHFLNTLLAKLFSSAFGSGELVLRLPGLLGYALFLSFGFRLLNRSVTRPMAVLGLLLLNLNPYVLDFFSLCRGYGLSLGLMMASLDFFLRFLAGPGSGRGSPGRPRDAALSLAAGAAAVLSNFSLLTLYLCQTVLIGIAGWLAGRQMSVSGGTGVSSPPPRRSGMLTGGLVVLLLGGFNLMVIKADLAGKSRAEAGGGLGLRALVLALIAAAAVSLAIAIGRVLARRKIFDGALWRALVVPTLILGGFVAYPLSILRRNGELYFGGTHGLLRDTWTSLADGSFYGVLYTPRQNLVAGLVCLSLVLLFIVAFAAHARNKRLDRAGPSAAMGALILLVSLALAVQHVLFQTPYPFARTALFFIPLFTLFAVFSLGSLGRIGPRTAEAAAVVLLAFLTALSGVHFAGRANAVMVAEWRIDADTKHLLEDLPAIKARLAPDAPVLRLGVEWNFMPSLAYYLRRDKPAWLDVRSVDIRPENDLYYLHETYDPLRMLLIENYPISGNILVRTKSEDSRTQPPGSGFLP